MARYGSRRTAAAAVAACLTVGLAVAGPARASVISSTATLPLLGVPYASSNGAGCFPAAGVCISAGAFTLTAPVSSSFNLAGQDITTGATYSGLLTNLGGTPLGPVFLSGTIEQEVLGRTFSTEVGSWSTEILALSLSGPLLGHTLSVTLDPAHTSGGTTSIAQVGNQQSHQFLINSFFDVFTELSLDSTPPLHTTRGPIHATAGVPEPASLVLLGGSLLLMSAARRRRAGR